MAGQQVRGREVTHGGTALKDVLELTIALAEGFAVTARPFNPTPQILLLTSPCAWILGPLHEIFPMFEL